MIETVCAKFRKQNHPNNTLLLTWAAFLSHFRPILHDLNVFQCFWSERQTQKHVFLSVFIGSAAVSYMVKLLFFSVFGQTQKHVVLSVFLRFCTVFAI